MRGKKTNETDVSFPASDVWQVYSSLELPVVIKNIPNYVKNVVILQGDGSVGTTYEIYTLPGTLPFDQYTEQVTRLDFEELIKDVDVVKGGFRDIGFTFYQTKFEILSKGSSQDCTVRSSVSYEIEDKYAENEKYVDTSGLGRIAKAVEEYIRNKKAGPEFNTAGLPG